MNTGLIIISVVIFLIIGVVLFIILRQKSWDLVPIIIPNGGGTRPEVFIMGIKNPAYLPDVISINEYLKGSNLILANTAQFQDAIKAGMNSEKCIRFLYFQSSSTTGLTGGSLGCKTKGQANFDQLAVYGLKPKKGTTTGIFKYSKIYPFSTTKWSRYN
jgi:hypothetical protein